MGSADFNRSFAEASAKFSPNETLDIHTNGFESRSFFARFAGFAGLWVFLIFLAQAASDLLTSRVAGWPLIAFMGVAAFLFRRRMSITE